MSCKDEHVDNDWSPAAKPQPVVGQFWLKVVEKTRGTVPKVRTSYVPVPCQHCQGTGNDSNAPCMTAATGGAVYRRPDGIVMIDPAKAVGQHQIVNACPYGAIYWNDALNIPQKCTGCAHILDTGPLPMMTDGKGNPAATPRCVDGCPTGALKFGDFADLQGALANTEELRPDLNTKPRVVYKYLPHRFIAGALYDPVKDICLENAKVTLTDLVTGGVSSVDSDNYGDFWFEYLPEDHVYSVKIDMPGYFGKTLGAIGVAGNDVNLGDIALYGM